jgi:hypothetical protein
MNNLTKLAENTANCLFGFECTEESRQYDRGQQRWQNIQGQQYDRGQGQQYDRGPGQQYDRGQGQQYDRGPGQQYDRGQGSIKGYGDRPLPESSSKAGYFIIGILALLLMTFTLDSEKEEQRRTFNSINS